MMSAQSYKVRHCAEQISFITDVPYLPELSGDSLYWSLVKQGKSVIPCLISNLSNTKQTDVVIPNYGGKNCVGDIAFSILCHIIHNIPIKDFILKNNRYPSSEDMTYMSFVSYRKNNRRFLKRKLREWYSHNQNNLEWVEDTITYNTARNWFYPLNHNPAHGYFIAK